MTDRCSPVVGTERKGDRDKGRERPIFEPGELVSSDDGVFAFRIIQLVGEGRCCLVYSCQSLREEAKFALKFFKRGPSYYGAIQREQYILETIGADPENNMVTCYGYFAFRGVYVQVMELLESNIRQIIFKNNRQGLSPWVTQNFARDMLRSLNVLHSHCFVHADLKPANVMWSPRYGKFKLLDFGLTFHTEEIDLYPIQSSGYRAPEVSTWIKYDEIRKSRKRKLQSDDLNEADSNRHEKVPYKQTIPESSSQGEGSGSATKCDTQEPTPTQHVLQTSPPQSSPSLPADVDKRGPPPPRPRQSCDVWSFGCLLAEVVTGEKLFSQVGKPVRGRGMTPEELLTVKLAGSEIKYKEKNQLSFFNQAKDLIQKCLVENPVKRISSLDGLGHPLFGLSEVDNVAPALCDMMLLPSPVLRLIDLLAVDLMVGPLEAAAADDVLRDVRDRAETHGRVSAVVRLGQDVLVEFSDPWCCLTAFECLPRMTFGGRRVVASFYPLGLWRRTTLVNRPSPELSVSSASAKRVSVTL